MAGTVLPSAPLVNAAQVFACCGVGYRRRVPDLRSIARRNVLRALREAEASERIAVALWKNLLAGGGDTPGDRADFIAFCRGLGRVAHAQLYQDMWVLFETGLQVDGFFVEFGAADGVAHSNTLLLEHLGWSGVLAEPNPAMARPLANNRSAAIDMRCVWKKSGDELEFLVTKDPEFSALVGLSLPDQHTGTERGDGAVTKVTTVALAELLADHDAPQVIDYLSVDTEGTEYEILGAFDFSSRKIRLLSIEHNNRPIEADIDQLMVANGYERRFPELSAWDGWYRLR
jgi:FkbM family methyltransferase